jgi:hypothetical protein
MADAGEDGPVPTERREWPDCVREAGEGEAARDGGNETGSKEKFSSLRAWQRDFCRVEDKFRSSSSACGERGPSLNAFGSPEMLETLSTACAGSISSWTSLKRTDWVVSAMMDEEVGEMAIARDR